MPRWVQKNDPVCLKPGQFSEQMFFRMIVWFAWEKKKKHGTLKYCFLLICLFSCGFLFLFVVGGVFVGGGFVLLFFCVCVLIIFKQEVT